MRPIKLLLGTALLLCSASAFAQFGSKTIIVFPSTPTGNCAQTQLGLNGSTGAVYSCGPSFTWIAVGGGGVGTVTSITCGTGLNGGTITGSGTCAILTAYQLPQSCSNGQTAIWGTPTANQWNCGTGSGGDTITSPNSTLNVGGTATATTLDLAGSAGKIMAGATPALTATPTLGASGTLGSLTFGNATSGLVTLEPVTGALGTVTASLPANTGTVAETNLAQTFSALQTFGTNISIGGVTAGGATGTGNVVFSSAPTLAGLTATGTVDFSGSTISKLRVGAGLTTSANGDIGYDTTNKNWHVWQNGADALAAIWSGALTTGHCPQISVSSGVTTLVDSGSTNCGGGGSTAWSAIGNPSGNLSLSMSSDTSLFTYGSGLAAAFEWYNSTAGTVSTTNSSPQLELQANYWTGSASAADDWTIQSSLAAGANGASTLAIAHSGSTGTPLVTVPGLQTTGSNGGITGTEGTCANAPATSGDDVFCPNSTAHWWEISGNNSTLEPVAGINGSITTTHLAGFASANEVNDSGVVAANVVTASSNFASGDLVQAAASNKTASDSGIASSKVMQNSATVTTQGETPFSTTTGGTYTNGDFWYPEFVPAANCNNTTAGAGWSIPSGGTVTCRAGTNNLGGYITITDTSSTFAQFMTVIPFDWDSATDPYIRFYLAAATDTTSGHTIIPQVKVSCSTAINGTTTDDHTFTAAQSSGTITIGASAVANGFYANSTVQFNSTSMSGCVAGGLFIVQVGRATDTATGNVNFYGATINWPRQTPGTAQAD